MDLKTIQQRIAQIEQFEEENRIARQTIKDQLENDPAYLEAISDVQMAVSKRKKIREEILKKVENQQIEAQIKENNEELSTLKDILSTELMDVYHKNNTDEIEDANGESRRFKIIAKLMPKKKGFEKRDEEGRYTTDDTAEVIPKGTVLDETL